MKPDTEKLMRAYLEIYKEFEDCYDKAIVFDSTTTRERIGLRAEQVKLFEIAMNDSLLGEILKEEILQRYQEILEAEQVKQETEEEAEAGEAMII